MAVLPTNQVDALTFCESHWPIWNSSPTSVGLTSGNVGLFKTATETARTDYDAAQAARLASKAATNTLASSISDMRSQASELIAQIKAFADLQANPSAIYSLAQIPQPAAPVPLPAPGKPTDFSVGLESDGSVTLSWDATNSSASTGAFFTISRKLPGQTSFTGIGGAPGTTSENRRSSFTDSSVPATAASNGAQYIVQGFRGTRFGTPSDAIIVQFGTDGGSFISGSNAATSIKMAA